MERKTSKIQMYRNYVAMMEKIGAEKSERVSYGVFHNVRPSTPQRNIFTHIGRGVEKMILKNEWKN